MRASGAGYRTVWGQVQLGAGHRAVLVGLVWARGALLRRLAVQLLEVRTDNEGRHPLPFFFSGTALSRSPLPSTAH